MSVVLRLDMVRDLARRYSRCSDMIEALDWAEEHGMLSDPPRPEAQAPVADPETSDPGAFLLDDPVSDAAAEGLKTLPSVPEPAPETAPPAPEPVAAGTPRAAEEDREIRAGRARGETFGVIGARLGRDPKSAKNRWYNTLRDQAGESPPAAARKPEPKPAPPAPRPAPPAELRGGLPWEAAEDRLLAEGRARGEPFAQIAARLGRPEAAAKARWYQCLRHKVEIMPALPASSASGAKASGLPDAGEDLSSSPPGGDDPDGPQGACSPLPQTGGGAGAAGPDPKHELVPPPDKERGTPQAKKPEPGAVVGSGGSAGPLQRRFRGELTAPQDSLQAKPVATPPVVSANLKPSAVPPSAGEGPPASALGAGAPPHAPAPPGLDSAERRLAQRLIGVRHPAPWTPALDLALVEGLTRGDKLAQVALDLGVDAAACKARFATLCPDPTMAAQQQLIRVLRAVLAAGAKGELAHG